jgi:uncharacterized protein YjbJ (UPF0337 family)
VQIRGERHRIANEKVDDVTDNQSLQAEGAAEKGTAQTKQGLEAVKDEVEAAAEEAKHTINDTSRPPKPAREFAG